MKALGPTTLGEALTHWGNHEATGYRRRQVHEFLLVSEDVLEQLPGLAIACLCRAPLVIEILRMRPCFAQMVNLYPSDLTRLQTYRQVALTQWRPADQSASEHVDRLAKERQIEAPLICTAKTRDGTFVGTDGEPIRVYDGLHRAAAWLRHLADGRDYPISAYLIGCRY